ncbi:hypothetical protein P7H62_14535 [Vagococcus carniphilus]|nr:hypothetical protein [Vagococcus carniphilus]MDT2832208.1 hypothetical protein [Vagococcus carniphilus]MDT2840708.1 hypothetical protein [Vagococcus carniphilus]MDT2855680.1 hypothetical protein [Vagococcus carniphilus]
MTRQQALEIGKQQADEWFKQQELEHRTSESIERIKNYVAKFGTIVKQ